VGRKRKDDPFGLAGTRIYIRRGKFYYFHRDGHAEQLPTSDPEQAKRLAAALANPVEDFGSVAHWMREFLADCKRRVAAKQLSQRTLDDYTDYTAADGPLMAFFGRMRPELIKPNMVQAYLELNAQLTPPRLTQSNRERACLSSCISWLLRRTDDPVPGLAVNPCMRASGVRRNPEKKRERYVTHEEYAAVYAAGNRAVRLAMELVYRTLQRPEVDLLAWTPANVKAKDGGKVLRFRQSKTGRLLDIALVGELGDLVRDAIGAVPQLHQPILHRLDGDAYTYSGLSAMLKQAQAKVRKAGGELAKMPSFGLRDLKGKGATDMWRDGVPIERIQLLCGHADKATTEAYIKARWTETAQPNNRQIG
jgi:integrase